MVQERYSQFTKASWCQRERERWHLSP